MQKRQWGDIRRGIGLRRAIYSTDRATGRYAGENWGIQRKVIIVTYRRDKKGIAELTAVG
jgi:hypothetical protein